MNEERKAEFDGSVKANIYYSSGKSHSSDISHFKDNKLKKEMGNYSGLSPLFPPEIKIEVGFFPKGRDFQWVSKGVSTPNQPLLENLYNLNQIKSKFLGYKINLSEVRNRDCPVHLKIEILKALRSNLILMIKQNKQLIKERKVDHLPFNVLNRKTEAHATA